MAHYAMLSEYHFTADVDEIRGAELYSADDRKAGRVRDVIFDHGSGEIRFLVVELANRRRVLLLPSSHVYRSVVDEDAFETDMAAAELDRLPQFDEKMLQDEKQWREHDKEHQRAWREFEERMLAEYKEKWHQAPVQHRPGSDRNVTPKEEPAPETPAEPGERVITGADLTPRRIAGKFPGASLMTTPGNPDAGEISLRPASERDLGFKAVPPSPRLHAFEQNIRENLADIRGRCQRCRASGWRVA